MYKPWHKPGSDYLVPQIQALEKPGFPRTVGWVYLEVHCTYNLLSTYSYNPSISRVTIVMELIYYKVGYKYNGPPSRVRSERPIVRSVGFLEQGCEVQMLGKQMLLWLVRPLGIEIFTNPKPKYPKPLTLNPKPLTLNT